MASDKAKEMAAKQKAALKAEKQRKKNSNDPKDWGWWKQIRETYKVTAEQDKRLPWLLLASFLIPVLIGVGVGVWQKQLWLWLPLAIMIGLVVAMQVFTRRVKKATYSRYEGQAGSSEVALSQLDKKKWTYTPAINGNRQLDMVHRVVGPAGIVLIGEGDANRLRPLLATEAKRHEQVAYGVPVTVIQMGRGDNQVPLDQLSAHIKKLPKAISPSQVVDTNNRIKALDNMRGRMNMPKGPVPTPKGVKRAMRGR